MAYPIEDQLDWLSKESRIFSWDMIVGLNRDKLNQMLSQLYIRRFNGQGFRDPFTAPLNIEGQKRFLQDAMLDVPQLSFPDLNANKPMAQLALRLISGSDVTVRIGPESRYVERLDYVSPIVGPLLTINVDLKKAGGTITVEKKLLLNLAHCEEKDFNLHFDLDIEIQRLGGAAFYALFEKLPEDEKVFELGKIKLHGNEMFRPRSFTLLPQADKDSATGDGAILAFVSMQEGHEGTEPPTSDKVFRYMIPAPLKDYSAAVMFNTKRIVSTWFVEHLHKVFNSTEPPTYLYDAKVLVGAAIPGGNLEAGAEKFYFPIRGPLGWVYYSGATEPAVIYSTDPNGVELTFGPRGAILNWPVSADIYYNVKIISPRGEHDVGRQLSKIRGALRGYIVPEGSPPKLKVKGLLFIPEFEEGSLSPKCPPADVKGRTMDFCKALGYEGSKSGWIEFLVLLTALTYSLIQVQLAKTLARLATIDVEKDLSKLTGELLELNLGETVVGGGLYAPGELVRYGKVAALDDGKVVSPAKTRLALGEQCQFTIEGDPVGFNWSIEPLVAGGAIVGSINPTTGLYSVPANAQFPGQFIRERIKAKWWGKAIYALVTVTRESLAIAPLLQIVRAGEMAQFSAGGARSEATYSWEIIGDASGASLNSHAGRVVQFTAGSGNHEFPLLAKVEVTAAGAKRAGSVILLPKQNFQTLTIIVDPPSNGDNIMNLRISDLVEDGDKVVWTVAQGESSGKVIKHSTDPQLAYVEAFENPIDRLLIIGVEVRDEDTDVLYSRGYCVLPLPFTEYKTVYQFLQNGV